MMTSYYSENNSSTIDTLLGDNVTDAVKTSVKANLISWSVLYVTIPTQIVFDVANFAGNVCILVTIGLLKELHTTHDAILAAIAVNDLCLGLLVPLHILDDIPDTFYFRSTKVSCVMWYQHSYTFTAVELTLLTLLCLDKLVTINLPLWYREHINTKRMLCAITCVCGYHVIVAIAANIDEFYFMDIEWKGPKSCSMGNVYPKWFFILQKSQESAEIMFSVCMCIQVSVVVIRTHKNILERTRTNNGCSAHLALREDRSRIVHAKIMSALTFIFIILWIPHIVLLLNVDRWPKNKLSLAVHLTRLARMLNSVLNAPVYAMSREVYRKAFSYILTTPPHRWKYLQRWLNKIRSKHEHKAISLTVPNGNHTSETMAPASEV